MGYFSGLKRDKLQISVLNIVDLIRRKIDVSNFSSADHFCGQCCCHWARGQIDTNKRL